MSITSSAPLEEIRKKLQQGLNPDYLEIIDESFRHQGHEGYGEVSHVHVIIDAPCLKGKKTLDQHRQVYAILQEELATSLHSLKITVHSSGEIKTS